VRRWNRLKTVTVSSEVDPGTTPSDVVAKLRPWLDGERAGWGLGYLYEFGGEEETSFKANQAIGEQVPTGALIIVLSDIVINNAIVLIDRIEIDKNGLEPARAVVEAAQRRFRPILLTTATTIAGLIPLWLGGGPMWEPLAITIMFGLLFATLLTLGVVPLRSLFDYLEGGDTLDEFLRQFPSVKRDQAIAALELACETLLTRARSA